MLRFNKEFIKENSTKISTVYSTVSDAERIKNIRNRMEGKINLEEKENKEIESIKENKDVYYDRINALKNIKKD